jgi:hypothetical protein
MSAVSTARVLACFYFFHPRVSLGKLRIPASTGCLVFPFCKHICIEYCNWSSTAQPLVDSLCTAFCVIFRNLKRCKLSLSCVYKPCRGATSSTIFRKAYHSRFPLRLSPSKYDAITTSRIHLQPGMPCFRSKYMLILSSDRIHGKQRLEAQYQEPSNFSTCLSASIVSSRMKLKMIWSKLCLHIRELKAQGNLKARKRVWQRMLVRILATTNNSSAWLINTL